MNEPIQALRCPDCGRIDPDCYCGIDLAEHLLMPPPASDLYAGDEQRDQGPRE